ncbi:MAG: hypothetical protein M1454_02060 [Candidatus Thermoplasmatota archaeon]|nr:hypothetical protein [Candidatus Thermoplasmatota archaeon]MCL5731582.1 hypothetical protein [Candidatus Thermoplasmatota archaeon]
MNISFEMRAARQIMVEQRYLSVRGMVYRRSRGKPAGLDPRSLKRYVRINYVVSWISFSIISLILFYFRSSGAIDLQDISNITLMVMIYAFFISMYNALLLFNSVVDNGTMRPLEALPLGSPWRIFAICYLVYYGSTALAIVIPSLVLDYIFLGRIAFLFSGAIWAITSVLAGGSLGIWIAMVTMGRVKRAAGRGNYLLGIAKLAAIVLVFGGFELILFDPAILAFQFSGIGSYSYLTFLAGVPYILFFSSQSFAGTLLNISASVVYLLVFALAFFEVCRKTSPLLTEARIISYRDTFLNGVRKHGVTRSFVSKDARYLTRNTNNGIVMIVPAIVAIPLVLPFAYSGGSVFDPLGILLTMLSLSAICAAFFPVMSMLSETEGIGLLKSLPVTRRQMVWSKITLDTIIFSVFMVPASFFGLYEISAPFLYYPIIPMALIFIFLYSSIFNFSGIVRKLPEEVTRITPDSFGGNLGLIITFVRTMLFTIIPVVAGIEIYRGISSDRPFSIMGMEAEILVIASIVFIIMVYAVFKLFRSASGNSAV